jgi:DNA excision repair protein ERCC-2
VSKPAITASVREVVTFVLRTGDLGRGTGFSGRRRALEGTRGHQRLQHQRPAGYQAEVPVEWRFEDEHFVFLLKGRMDGVLADGDSVLVEEIKTVRGELDRPVDPLHWAQAKVYAALFVSERPLSAITVRLTYLELESGDTRQFDEVFQTAELKTFFEALMAEYLGWVREFQVWCRQRNESIRRLPFPFAVYREGQRTLAVSVYKTIRSRGKLFAEAPTGIGKTVSTLFPAVKALAEGCAEKVFYLTAKNSARTVAEQALDRMDEAGLKLRRVTITARDKICFNQGQSCDVRACPYAIGYYDRIKEALRDGFSSTTFRRKEISILAERHKVCPFELSLDLSQWADAVICDYNYVFDPSVSLDRYFDGEKQHYAVLIDEAHNLLERAREMFSADLTRAELLEIKDLIAADLPECARALGRLCAAFRADKGEEWIEREGVSVSVAAPRKFGQVLERFIERAEVWLARNEPALFREALLEVYFRALGFKNTLERFDDCYVTLFERENMRMRLFCMDPSALLAEVLRRSGSAVFFSATMRPVQFFREALGGDLAAETLQLKSPFAQENLLVLVHAGIPTRFARRSESYAAVVENVAALVQARPGNYLIFFPSYHYLQEVARRFGELCPHLRSLVQTAGMNEKERDAFLSEFSEGGQVIGFAVMGGVFGEGIDLTGGRLIGAVVVGVGLPQICLERDLIKEWHQRRGSPGFDFAYTFPGMNRVLQALGRVIRTETDRGIVLLLDERFGETRYRRLFPPWWRIRGVRSAEEVQAEAAGFWQEEQTGTASAQLLGTTRTSGQPAERGTFPPAVAQQ